LTVNGFAATLSPYTLCRKNIDTGTRQKRGEEEGAKLFSCSSVVVLTENLALHARRRTRLNNVYPTTAIALFASSVWESRVGYLVITKSKVVSMGMGTF
jgi:hypothetical protein